MKKQGDVEEEIWVVDGDTAICELGGDNTLFVVREPDGIRIKVQDYTGKKPKLIFSRFIGDLQLGHVFRRKKK